MSKELKELFDSLHTAFSEFREANDERIKQLESKGKADPLLEEKVDRANNHITELETNIEDTQKALKNRLDDLELQFQHIGQGGVGSYHSENIKDEARKFFSAVKNKPEESVEVDVEAYVGYKKAFNLYLRYGEKALTPEIRNLLQVGSDPDGGQWVPAATASRIITRIHETSPMRQIANVITIGTDRYEIPKDLEEGSTGGWVGEVQSRSDTGTPEVGMQEIPVHEHYAMPAITQKMLDDSVFPIEPWLSGKISTALVKAENTAFVSGNGIMKPRGFTSYTSVATTSEDGDRAWGKHQYLKTGVSGGFKVLSGQSGPGDIFIEVADRLKVEYQTGAVWVMNKLTKAECRKLKDSNGNYYILPNLAGPAADTLYGYPIVIFADMPSISANSFSIAFGNFDVGYQIVDRFGIRVLRDPFTTKGRIKYYTTKRTGGDCTNFDAIKFIKFGTS